MKIEFVTSNGDTVSAQAQAGDNLLRVAQAAGLPLEGTCEGQMAWIHERGGSRSVKVRRKDEDES